MLFRLAAILALTGAIATVACTGLGAWHTLPWALLAAVTGASLAWRTPDKD
jgi:hypothetical protein